MQDLTKHKKVLLTGGTGFFGSHIKEQLLKNGYQVYSFGRGRCDMLDKESLRGVFKDSKPDYVIHAAGFNGGIEFNKLYPADILNKNIRMSLNLFDCCVEFETEKVLSIISSCAYPDGDELINEDSLFNGRANDSIASHAFAKRLLQEASISYNKQYKLNAVTVAVTNLFGERSSTDPTKSKVVEAVIKKIVDAKRNNDKSVEFWGTGAPKRQFMYAQDASKCIIHALEYYTNNTQPLNIGTPTEVTIKQLVNEVKTIVEYNGKIMWDKSKNDGQMRKMLDISTLQSLCPDFEFTDFTTALTNTINWYTNECK